MYSHMYLSFQMVKNNTLTDDWMEEGVWKPQTPNLPLTLRVAVDSLRCLENSIHHPYPDIYNQKTNLAG